MRANRPQLSILVALTALTWACSSGTGPEDPALVVDILDATTAHPAKVTVSFQVTNRDGEPVADIQLEDLELLDNGQSDSEFESSKAFQPTPGRFLTSVALLLDMSGSITGSQAFASLKTAAKAFVDNALAASGVEVGVWWFDGAADIVQLSPFTDDGARLKAAIDSLSSSVTRDNSTNLNGAIQLGVGVVTDRLQDPSLRDVLQTGALVVFTDGTDQANRVTATAATASVTQAPSNMSVYSIGLRGEIDEQFLTTIGKSGSAFADDTSALLTQFSGIGREIESLANSFYILAYCSPRRSGLSNELIIRVRRGEEWGEGTTNYSASGFTGGCTV